MFAQSEGKCFVINRRMQLIPLTAEPAYGKALFVLVEDGTSTPRIHFPFVVYIFEPFGRIISNLLLYHTKYILTIPKSFLYLTS